MSVTFGFVRLRSVHDAESTTKSDRLDEGLAVQLSCRERLSAPNKEKPAS